MASDEVRNLTRQLYEMFSSGDASVLERLISNRRGTTVIGTDPNEWWTDREQILTTLAAQARELSQSGIRVESGDLAVEDEDGFAWVADRPKFVMPDGSTVEGRVTGVFLREDDSWRIVQWHASLGVPNEEAIGEELTT
jgi:ketosteroid isomerase-like protein